MKCGVVDCQKEAVCIGIEDKFGCCDDHCSHDGEGSECCTRSNCKETKEKEPKE